MHIEILLLACVLTTTAQKLRTFSVALSSSPIYPNETEILNHTLSADSSFGVLTHFWVTGEPALDFATFSYYIDGETQPSIVFIPSMLVGAGFNDQAAPWGTKWMGKGANERGWFNNFRVPFQKSIRVTGKLASSETQSFTLPINARLVLQKIENRLYEALDFVTVANITTGQGFLLSHTLAVSSASINFIEGCYHAYTEYDQPFPGEGISTGTEDYFDSAFTFDAGQFHFEISGFTHFKNQEGTFELSAYRMHDMDPIFFTNGFRFVWRNGDLLDDRGVKCILESGGHPAGSPAKSIVTSYAWVYVW
ncbi:unnamed protein product [Rotaria sordida]|uniref:Uncharacterized protein n=1 Tax=Rotaria sordida TaxID=392033 RepID=A0A815RA06_9BILA|nr:unnamed protein product [Rotaria sordida]CAF1474621.1 unnamed protein product [Rotaria sordida]